MKKQWISCAIILIILLIFAGILFNREILLRIGLISVGFTVLYLASRKKPVSAYNMSIKMHQEKTDVGTEETGFCSVAANEEALESLKQLADFLKYPEKYKAMGAHLPRGILLYGPPGTGKTLLARSLAQEANVPFFSMSGSDFVQMYAGVGASRVRELFEKARKAGKCVVFIDEIDAMGKRRSDQSSDERDQTLNALLSEMSGFRSSDHIVVIAATNRLDTLDPALTRPGRFDRKIEVPLPSRQARLEILRLHAQNKPLSKSVDLESLAGQTVQFSGAALENLLNEAAICAARRNAPEIEPNDLNRAYLHEVTGEDQKCQVKHAELSQIALHESGHAIATHFLQPQNHLIRLSILPSGKGAAGYNLAIPEEHSLLSEKQLLAQIQVLLAGRAAEMLVDPENGLSSGAANDLSRASELCAAMVLDLGMGGETAVSLRALQKACGANNGEVMEKCRKTLQQQFDQVTELLREHVDLLMHLTETLLTQEAMDSSQIEAFFLQNSV